MRRRRAGRRIPPRLAASPQAHVREQTGARWLCRKRRYRCVRTFAVRRRPANSFPGQCSLIFFECSSCSPLQIGPPGRSLNAGSDSIAGRLPGQDTQLADEYNSDEHVRVALTQSSPPLFVGSRRGLMPAPGRATSRYNAPPAVGVIGRSWSPVRLQFGASLAP